MFAMLSDVTVLNDKIDMFIACAPIVYLTNIQQESLKILSQEWKKVYLSTKLLKVYELNDQFLDDIKQLCNQFNEVCDFVYD